MLIIAHRTVCRCISLWKNLKMTPIITRRQVAMVKGKGTIFAALLNC